tara:strand:+ start:31 stop:525 length:495 start_codon:yes stop_codon:yes gene_type:complete
MTFFKTLTSLIIISILLVSNSLSDSHDNTQNIIEKAKEINKEVKKKQALNSTEEPLPLNDPFVGDASMSGRTEVTLLEDSQNSNEPKSGSSLYNYKLVGVVASESDSFATLIDASGDTLTLKLFEELSPGVKLVALNNKEAVFERDEDSYLVINFKNQIVERAR